METRGESSRRTAVFRAWKCDQRMSRFCKSKISIPYDHSMFRVLRYEHMKNSVSDQVKNVGRKFPSASPEFYFGPCKPQAYQRQTLVAFPFPSSRKQNSTANFMSQQSTHHL